MNREHHTQSRCRLAALEAAFRLVYDILDGTRYGRRTGGGLRIQAAVRMLAAALCRSEFQPSEDVREQVEESLRRIRAEVERLRETGFLSSDRILRAREAVDEMALHAAEALGEKVP